MIGMHRLTEKYTDGMQVYSGQRLDSFRPSLIGLLKATRKKKKIVMYNGHKRENDPAI